MGFTKPRDEYALRLAHLLLALNEKGKTRTDLLRAAKMEKSSLYGWGLKVLRDDGRGEPTLRKLERALGRL